MTVAQNHKINSCQSSRQLYFTSSAYS